MNPILPRSGKREGKEGICDRIGVKGVSGVRLMREVEGMKEGERKSEPY